MCSKKKRKRKSSTIYINVVFDENSSKVIDIYTKGSRATPTLKTDGTKIKMDDKPNSIEDKTCGINRNKIETKTDEDNKLIEQLTYEKIKEANQEISNTIETLRKRFQELKNDINTKNELSILKTKSIVQNRTSINQTSTQSSTILKRNTIKTKESVTLKVWHQNKYFDSNESEFTPVGVASRCRNKLMSKLSKFFYFRRGKRKTESGNASSGKGYNDSNWIGKLQAKLEKSKISARLRWKPKVTIEKNRVRKKSQVNFLNPIQTWILRNTKRDRRAFIEDAKEFSRRIEGIIRYKPKPKLNLSIDEDAEIDISNEIVYDVINYDDSLEASEEETVKIAQSHENMQKLNLNSIMRSPLERNIDTDKDRRDKKYNIIYVNVITDGEFNVDQNRVYELQDSSDKGSQTTISRSKLTQSILNDYYKHMMPYTESSGCISESNVYSLDTTDHSSGANKIYNVSQSCPNIYKDIYKDICYENESSESLESSDDGNIFQKLKEWTLSRILEKEEELRLQPKDSLIVLRKRQLYAFKNKFKPEFQIETSKKTTGKGDTVKFKELHNNLSKHKSTPPKTISSVYSCNSCKIDCIGNQPTIKIKDINTQCDSSSCSIRSAKTCACANRNINETIQNKQVIIVCKRCRCAKVSSQSSNTCCNKNCKKRSKNTKNSSLGGVRSKIKKTNSSSSITKKSSSCCCNSKAYKKRLIKRVGDENEVLVLIRRKCFCDTPKGSLSSDSKGGNSIRTVKNSDKTKEKRICKKCEINQKRLKLLARAQGNLDCNDFAIQDYNKNNDCTNPACSKFSGKNLNNNKIDMQISNVTNLLRKNSSKNSQNTTSDLIEIDFLVKLKKQNQKPNENFENNKDVYLYNADNKNDLNIKLIIKSNKNNITIEKKPTVNEIDEFARKISDKFRTVSTTASRNNQDTDFSINRVTISQKSFTIDKTIINKANKNKHIEKSSKTTRNEPETCKEISSEGKNIPTKTDQSTRGKITNILINTNKNKDKLTSGNITAKSREKNNQRGNRTNNQNKVVSDDVTKEEKELLNIILNKITEKNEIKRKEKPLEEKFAEILQTEEAKKAVLKIYAKSTQSQKHFIATLPKFYEFYDGYD